jgi:hypothetical protein
MAETKDKKAKVWAKASHDWYVEPRFAVELLLEHERFPGGVYDPCCGQGTIVKACLDQGLPAVGSDLIRRMYNRPSWFLGAADFLARRWPLAIKPNIISNPPFYRAKGVEVFIRRALAIPNIQKVAVYCDIRFLTSEGRANGLFQKFTPARVWIISPRPSCPPGEYLAQGNEAGGGQADWCWLVFEPRLGTKPGETLLNWAHSEKEALRRGRQKK